MNRKMFYLNSISQKLENILADDDPSTEKERQIERVLDRYCYQKWVETKLPQSLVKLTDYYFYNCDKKDYSYMRLIDYTHTAINQMAYEYEFEKHNQA